MAMDSMKMKIAMMSDASVYPGASEIPNDGVDQDCDGSDFIIPDDDGDGFTADVDCDDSRCINLSGATEIPNDGIDQNCNGTDLVVGVDNDGDGFDVDEDCDDNDASVYPGAQLRSSMMVLIKIVMALTL